MLNSGLKVVRIGTVNLTFMVEMKYLSRWATNAVVVEGDTVDADQCSDQLKMKIRNKFKGLGPIGSNHFFAFQCSRRFASNFDDDRRRHLKVVSVVRQNTLKVMFVPGVNPVSRKMASKCLIDHKHL